MLKKCRENVEKVWEKCGKCMKKRNRVEKVTTRVDKMCEKNVEKVW